MKYRKLGKTGFEVSEISLGTWQLGGGWGKPFDEEEAYRTLNLAIDEGINFLDTADVYSGGLSEKAVGKIIRERKEDIVLATKAGRRLNPHVPEGYTPANIEGFIDDSLKNTGCDSLDLVQLHCPPTDVYYKPELFGALDRMREAGKIRHYGVSVERGGRGSESYRVSRRGDGTDHIQHVPAETGGAVLLSGGDKGCGHHRARSPGQRPVDR